MIKTLKQLYGDKNTYPSQHVIACDGELNITWQELLNRSQAWNEDVATASTNSVAIYHDDGIEFIALLLACWRNNKTPIVPANTLADTCVQLQQLTATLLGQFPNDIAITGSNLSSVSNSNDNDVSALTIFTSGSSGVPTPIHKSFAQLDNELHTLEQSWGKQLANTVITGTVSHHHIYGLLFRLLWPLSSARLFTISARSYWEQIIHDSIRYKKVSLVSSPAHYKNMPDLDWPSAASKLAIVFSSGAPLSKKSAHLANAALAQPVIEVYGSSETGGVAWRDQLSSDNWTCLTKIEVKASSAGLLSIKSPHLPSSDWYQTADRAKVTAHGDFKLLGRADNIAKVSGKRVSLSQIEKYLLSHPWVTQAKVIQLEQKGGRIGAAITLNSDGNDHLIDQGKLSTNKTLQAYLSYNTEAVALPRYWRYLAALPENQQGKVTAASIAIMFDNIEQPKYPRTENFDYIDSNNCQINFFIPADLYYFNGHFLGRPILPGVVQLHWAIHYGKELFNVIGSFQRLEAVKFQQVIRADEHATLKLKYDSSKTKLTFSFSNGDTSFSSGRIVFGGSGDDI
jgi:acyl-coenzyme A synthetase/AMP-(fatty) acid ligase